MATTSGPGTLERRVEVQTTARLKKRHDIRLPSCLVEISRQEEARLVERG
jgi:hypothetical protein